MKQIALYEAKNTLSALIDEVERSGEEVIITRHGKPAARLGPARPRRSGDEMRALGARLAAHRARMAIANEGRPRLSWEELKAVMEDDIG
jgi:prevent-host-death family protein